MATLAFRVDASRAIGMGHAMRCLALAQAWKDRGNRAIFLAAESDSFGARLEREGFDLVGIRGTPASREDALETIQAARSNQSEWVVVDGYRFEASYLDVLKDSGLSVLAIDDYGHT